MKSSSLLLTAGLIISMMQVTLAQDKPVKKPERPGQQKEQMAAGENMKIKKFPLAVQCWTFRNFTFLETLPKVKALGIDYIQAYPGQKLGGDWPEAKFDHHMTDEQINWVWEKLNEYWITVVAYGVVDLGSDEASMRTVFDFARKLGIQVIATEPEFGDFPLIEKMVQEYDLKVAVHNHPMPSRYALPTTAHSQLQGLDPRIGACADTGHWMRSSVQPVEALQLLKDRIVDVHLKDLNAFGKKNAYDVPFGQGKANIRAILAELSAQDYDGYLTIEHENEKEILNPSPSILTGVEYIQSITYFTGYQELLIKNRGRYSKHGWNHYGPGHFSLDEKTGVLKSHGGMGLFWYSVKQFKDFVLELDFKSAESTTNSGIFLRVPGLPFSDDYIYHSFEVQIYDAGQGIHKTGAIYDAEPPRLDAFKKPGEWNHYKITFQGDRIQVELNDQLIVDWNAEPRGKIRDFAPLGYIGLQNHDDQSPVYFRNIFVKELN